MAEEAPAEQPTVFYPQSAMDSNIQYRLAYQPVYISDQDSNVYLAGPILQQIPVQEKGFLESLTETCKIGAKRVSDATAPVGKKISETANRVGEAVKPVAQKVGDSFKNAVETTSQKFEEFTKNHQNEPPKPATANPAPAQPPQ